MSNIFIYNFIQANKYIYRRNRKIKYDNNKKKI